MLPQGGNPADYHRAMDPTSTTIGAAAGTAFGVGPSAHMRSPSMRAQCEQGVVAQPGWAPSDGGLWRKGDNEAERDSSNSDVHAVPLLGEIGDDDGEGRANASQAQKFVAELMEVVIEKGLHRHQHFVSNYSPTAEDTWCCCAAPRPAATLWFSIRCDISRTAGATHSRQGCRSAYQSCVRHL